MRKREGLVEVCMTLVRKRESLVEVLTTLVGKRESLVRVCKSLVEKREVLVEVCRTLVGKREGLVEKRGTLVEWPGRIDGSNRFVFSGLWEFEGVTFWLNNSPPHPLTPSPKERGNTS